MPKNSERTSWDRIVEGLKDANLRPTQEVAARLCGVSQSAVSQWKEGGPGLENAKILATKLNLCVEWILTEQGPKRPGPPMDPVAQKLWDLWARIPPEDRGEVVGFAKGLIRTRPSVIRAGRGP